MSISLERINTNLNKAKFSFFDKNLNKVFKNRIILHFGRKPNLVFHENLKMSLKTDLVFSNTQY